MQSSHLRFKLWLRYVDDTFVIWPHGAETLTAFLTHLNNIRPSIQFTMEKESNGTIAFLDVLVKRENDGILTSVFRKTTHTDRYLNYHSHHHLAGVINCLCQRAVRLCDPTTLHEEIAHLHTVLKANGYTSSPLYTK